MLRKKGNGRPAKRTRSQIPEPAIMDSTARTRPRQILLDFLGDSARHRQPPIPSPPHNGTPTSQAAAAAISRRAPNLRELVFSYIASRGRDGSTADEVCTALAMWPQTATPRIRELAKAGRIVKTGRTRPTRSGCSATVWTTLTEEKTGERQKAAGN